MNGDGVWIVSGVGAIVTMLGFIWMASLSSPQWVNYQYAMLIGGLAVEIYGILFWCVCAGEGQEP